MTSAAPQPGDYGVVRTGGFYAWLIRHACRSDFDHAFVICDGGQIIEAEPGGARFGELAEYAGHDMLISTEPLTPAQRTAVVNAAIGYLGTPYGWTDILRLGLRTAGIQWGWLTRRADRERAMICSQIVAAAGQTAGLDWNCGRDCPAAVTPADLARRPGMRPWPAS